MRLHDIVHRHARTVPDRLAIVAEDRQFTFGELARRADTVANALSSVARPGDRVAIVAQNIVEYVECCYGVAAAGMVLTHLNYRLNPSEWVWILNDSSARVLVVQEVFWEALEPLVDQVPSLQQVVVVGARSGGTRTHGVCEYEDFLAAASSSPPTVSVTDDDPVWILYTSGTTGRPKGAVLSHRNLMTAVLQQVIEYQPGARERALLAFPLCHVGGNSVPTYHLRAGLVVLAKAFEPEAWMKTVEQERITVSGLAPTMLHALLLHPKFGNYDLRSLDSIGYGGSAITSDVLAEAIERMGAIFYSGFGMTELGGHALNHPKDAHARAISGEAHLLQSCGQPMCLAMAKIVRPDMTDCAVDEVGEMVFRGDQVLQRYWGNDQATLDAFTGGWFHSGDLGRCDAEGNFYVVDRLKDMIVTGGENVYCAEVENVIAQLDNVQEVAVIGLPDPQWGERVTAVVVPTAGASVDEHDITQACRRELGGYKVPKTVLIRDALPKSLSGKVLKRQLRAEYGETAAPGQMTVEEAR